MPNLAKLLRSRRGETLLETVLSLALLGILMVAFTTMILTAVRMNQQASREEAAYEADLQQAEQGQGTYGQGQARLTFDDPALGAQDLTVETYTAGRFFGYRPEEGTQP